uniref:Gene 3 protein n=1 Tax=Anthurium amnicola TaxID=1678845 RepID=A0A1D1Y832_9ARAE
MHSEYFDHSYEPYSSNSPFGIEEYIPEAQSSNIEDSDKEESDDAQESFTQESFTQEVRRPLVPLLNVSNPEYHRPKGRPPKRLKSSIEESKNLDVVQRTCGYCSAKGHNIRSCSKYKATLNIDKENTINEV